MDFKLYVITNQNIAQGKDNLEVVKEAIIGGADIIQLREKDMSTRNLVNMGNELKVITKSAEVPLIVNDRVDIALAIDADGVHLGQDDLPIKEARKMMGNDKIIGISTHSLEQAIEAAAMGADYIGVGPVFPTQTKPNYNPVGLELVEKVSQRVEIPFVAIGGIKLDNIHEVIKAGAKRVAVVSGIVGVEDIESAARSYYKNLIKCL
ncbi:thiamine phosphate synthase [Selenihalanaerobacter shriftii]|uniref:Thiamine-phosphate synthase n=1 Tax=Selenihalanaerobacter shriftii TaxID=142842 RepID=A0A1T4R874_9FIRM|nr:thiamine phosphate synthase [Selenihalanaerobacter shriftii]SKA12135.1 thiamine-phosphate diphosphorylase [Selenihalanaerobacter shriftii]